MRASLRLEPDVCNEIRALKAIRHPNVISLVHEQELDGFDFPCVMPLLRDGDQVEIAMVPAFALVLGSRSFFASCS